MRRSRRPPPGRTCRSRRRRRVPDRLADAGLPAERLADHERGADRHDRRGEHAPRTGRWRTAPSTSSPADRLERLRGVWPPSRWSRPSRRSSSRWRPRCRPRSRWSTPTRPPRRPARRRSSSSPMPFSATATLQVELHVGRDRRADDGHHQQQHLAGARSNVGVRRALPTAFQSGWARKAAAM